MKQRQTFVRLLFAVAVILCSLTSFAQTPEIRLKAAITGTGRAVLTGSRTPLVRGAQDLGAVAPDTPIPGITLVFRRSAAQEADLQQVLSELQDKSSPLFHHWFTPESFGARFGMADADIATTETWLEAHGFRIDRVSRARDRITFSGTALQVQAAFGAELHHYRAGGELHMAPAADLTLPEVLAPVTAAVLHLSDFRPKPRYKVPARARPDFTSASTQAHYLGPKDVATMYDLNNLYQSGVTGTGQGLAVAGQSYVNTGLGSAISDFQADLTQAGTVVPVLVPGSGVEDISPGDASESEIDLEYASGIATSANVLFVYVGDNQNYSAFDAYSFAISDDIAPVVSISYGICETVLGQSDFDQAEAIYEQAEAQGQTLVAAAGDSGSTSCVNYTTSQGVTTAEQQALAVYFPASSPLVIAVGGTQMAAGTFSPGASTYWQSATTSDLTNSLLSYVPEVVWNEGAALDSIAAGGGGTSTYFPRPSWQSGIPGIPAGAFRLLPDISLQASIESPGYLFCTDDSSSLADEGQTSSCVDGLAGSNGDYTLAGGTSFAAPIFAGFLTLLNQTEHSSGAGDIHTTLYGLAANASSYSTVFHDITSGSNGCSASVAACSSAGESNYSATTGYDEATGLGSVDFGALVQAWPASSSAALQSTLVQLNPMTTTATAGATVPVSITVQSLTSSSATVPSGSVSVTVDGVVQQASLAFSATNPAVPSATVSYNLVAPLTTGTHVLTVAYSGDPQHAASTATAAVLVGSGLATGTVTLAAGNLTVTANGSGSTQITATPAGGYSGRLFWTLSAAGTFDITACYSIASLPVSGVSTTQLEIGVGTACGSASERGAFHPIGGRTTTAFARPVRQQPRPSRPAAAAAGLILCGLLAAVRKRRLGFTLLLALVAFTAAGLGLTGCGGGSSGTSPTPTPTPPPVTGTNYTLTLTGTDSVNGTIAASTSFTLTVQ